MSAIPKTEPYLTPEEYLRRERAAEFKSEYFNGYVVAMAGATHAHNRLAGNFSGLLYRQLRGRPCEALGSDMKLRIEKANLFRYPDLSAFCGPIDYYDAIRDAYCNPALIVEVLSPGTENYDRTEKFALYRLVDSLREYVLVAQDRVEVEVHRKQPDGRWNATVFTELCDVARLEFVGCDLSLAELYEKVEFSPT